MSKLGNYITNSSNVTLKENNWWFSRENQRKIIFDIAIKLVVDSGEEPSQAIELAEELVDTYHKRHVQKSTRID